MKIIGTVLIAATAVSCGRSGGGGNPAPGAKPKAPIENREEGNGTATGASASNASSSASGTPAAAVATTSATPASCGVEGALIFNAKKKKFFYCDAKAKKYKLLTGASVSSNGAKLLISETLFANQVHYTKFANGKSVDKDNLQAGNNREASQVQFDSGIQGCTPLEPAGMSYTGPSSFRYYTQLTDKVTSVTDSLAEARGINRRPFGMCLKEVRVLQLTDGRILVSAEAVPDQSIIKQIDNDNREWTKANQNRMRAIAKAQLSFRTVFVAARNASGLYAFTHNYAAPSIETIFARTDVKSHVHVTVDFTLNLKSKQPEMRIAAKTNMGNADTRIDQNGLIHKISGLNVRPFIDGLQAASLLKKPAPALFVLQSPKSVPGLAERRDAFIKECTVAYKTAFDEYGELRTDGATPSPTLITLEVMRARAKMPKEKVDLSSDSYHLLPKRYCHNIFTAISKVKSLNLANGGDVSKRASDNIGGDYRPIDMRIVGKKAIDHDRDFGRRTLRRVRITDVSVLRHFTDLEILVLKDNEISNIAPLGALAKLHVLDLSRTVKGKYVEAKRSRFDLAPLAGLIKLARLDLTNQFIVGSGLAPLANLYQLRQLDINHTGDRSRSNGIRADIGEPGANQLVHLAGLENLEVIKLNGIAPTLVNDLRPLKKLRRLRIVGLAPSVDNPVYTGRSYVKNWDAQNRYRTVTKTFRHHHSDTKYDVDLRTKPSLRD